MPFPQTSTPPEQRRFGAHISIAGGIEQAFSRAAGAGCDCFQIFTSNQRQWSAPPLLRSTIHAWQNAREQTGIGPVIAHASYLINLAAPDCDIWRQSMNAMVDQLRRSESLGIVGLVVHPGAYGHTDKTRGIRRISQALNRILRRTHALAVKIVLETTAGQGTSIGHRFEELADIIEQINDPGRVGVCVDTCHVFAAGYDIRTDSGYHKTIASLRKTVGLQRIMCFHLNDSKKPLGSRVDRHEHIGQGHIGRKAFQRIVTDPRFFNIPMFLETPKGTDERGRDLDRKNLAILRRLSGSTPRQSGRARHKTALTHPPSAGPMQTPDPRKH